MSQEKFGRYEIKEEIGRGGMASVFHAYDPRFERDVAIKVLPREFLHDPQFRARFEREAKMVALLEHPAIVPVYDFGEEEGQPYIVMRYMSGGSLSDLLKKGPLPLNEVVKMITRLAPALDAAHAKGIIHRDLKPGNILFDQYGNAFLSDFGIARLTQAGAGTLTGGAILGTPAYMSPEQVQGGAEIDGRSDIYAMGVILYQVLTGKTPYQADTAAKLMMMHILEPIPSILAEKQDLPPLLDEVIEKAMAKTPETRFQTTAELAEAVEMAVKNVQAQEATRIGKLKGKDSAAPTIVRPAATILSPRKRQETPIPPPGKLPPSVAAAPPRKGIATWGWILGGFALLAAIGAVVIFGGGIVAIGARPTNTLSPSATVEIIAMVTPSTFTVTPSFTPEPSNTPLPPTDTPIPTNTSTITPLPPTPTETPTLQPLAPVIGNADKIAFLRNNDVWMVNLDGSELTQLTNDGAKKNGLQWTPDGQAVVFISGLCIKIVTIENGRMDNIACFEYVGSLDWFEISPDGSMAAISVNKQLYLIPYDREQLAQVEYWSDIKAMAPCQEMAPYASTTGAAYAVKEVHWGRDMKQLAVLMLGVDAGRQVDLVRVLDISRCLAIPPQMDEFPAERFSISGYNSRPILEHVAWDGRFLFALIGYVRNEGFGDLYIYNLDLHKATLKANPIRGVCCYRDPRFSPDGSYLAFAFQDIGSGAVGTIELYYIPFGSIGTGAQYQPIPLPADFFSNPKESPQPALRPASGR